MISRLWLPWISGLRLKSWSKFKGNTASRWLMRTSTGKKRRKNKRVPVVCLRPNKWKISSSCKSKAPDSKLQMIFLTIQRQSLLNKIQRTTKHFKTHRLSNAQSTPKRLFGTTRWRRLTICTWPRCQIKPMSLCIFMRRKNWTGTRNKISFWGKKCSKTKTKSTPWVKTTFLYPLTPEYLKFRQKYKLNCRKAKTSRRKSSHPCL